MCSKCCLFEGNEPLVTVVYISGSSACALQAKRTNIYIYICYTMIYIYICVRYNYTYHIASESTGKPESVERVCSKCAANYAKKNAFAHLLSGGTAEKKTAQTYGSRSGISVLRPGKCPYVHKVLPHPCQVASRAQHRTSCFS